MGIMRIQDKTGDTELTWDSADKNSIKAVADKFNELLYKGHMAYVKKDGGGEAIRKFDPNAQEIIVAAPLTGG